MARSVSGSGPSDAVALHTVTAPHAPVLRAAMRNAHLALPVAMVVIACMAVMALLPSSGAIAQRAPGLAAGGSPPRERDRGEDVRARDAWFYGQRAFPRPFIRRGAYLSARRQAARLPHVPGPRRDRGRTVGRPRATSASFAWTSIGPRPIDSPATLDDAGRVTALAVQSTQVIYAGAAAGGVWKTTNGGLNWKPMFDGQPSPAVGAVTIDPNNPSNVLVGTGEANFSADSYAGAGVFRSTNAGASWFKLTGSLLDGCSVADIVVKPGDSKTIGVAVVGAGVPGPTACPATSQGVYVSTDGGVTWALKAPRPGGIFSPTGAFDLAISSTNAATWFAGMANGAVWRSTDSGQTWGPAMIDPNGARTQIAVAPSNPNFILAVVDIPPQGGRGERIDLYLSGDGGTTWNNTQLPVPRARRVCGRAAPTGLRQCWYDLTVAFDPATPRVFYLGAVPLYRYERPVGSGWTFTQVASAIHVDFHALAFDPAGTLWTGGDGGVNTLRWTPLTQFIVGKSGDLPITEFEPGISGDLKQLVGGTQDNGTLRYTGAQRWTQILGGDGGFSASDPTTTQTLFASQQNFVFQRSTDGGATWTRITPTLPAGDSGLFYSPLVNEPGAPRTLYAGSQRLWWSTDQGTTWAGVGAAFTNSISAIGTGTTTTAAANATAYVGFSTGGLQYSANITATTPTWTAGAPPAGDPPLPNRWVTDFWVNPNNPTEAYAALSGFGTAHLLHTTDGVTWRRSDGSLADVPVNAVTVDASGAFPILYVGTDIGVFASADGGATWADASTNLPRTVVMDLLVDVPNDVLIAATHGRGAYTAELSRAPPFASISTPAAITDPVVAAFNVPVKNVTTANLVLRVQGTTTNLPASITCQDASGAPASCATGPVSIARLQPASPLIPGQRYVASVNPSGAAAMTDGLGTDVLFAFKRFRASLKEAETTAAADYTWQTVKPVGTPGPLGGSYTQHHLNRASATFAFDGTQVTWITLKGPDQGIANVFIDNVLVASLDHYAATRTYNVRETFTGLSPGRHVIRIEPTGQRNPAATDTFVSVDALQVGDNTPLATPMVTYRWQPDSAFDSPIGYVRSDLGPTATASATTVTFTFRGTGVTWHTVADPSQGRARVTIDGVDQGVVDNYAATAKQIARTYSGLADTVHTMLITVLGTKQAASNGTFVAVDGFDVQ